MYTGLVRQVLVAVIGVTAAVVLAACASPATTPAPPTQAPPTTAAIVAPTATGGAQSMAATQTPVESPLVVNITITDLLISPSGVAAPTGRPLLLVIRNKGLKKHGYHVQGFEPKDGIWFETDPELDSHLALGHEITGLIQVTVPDEHAEHHTNSSLVPRQLSDINAIVTAGETKIVMFIPATAGTYTVTDPANPDLSASLYVF